MATADTKNIAAQTLAQLLPKLGLTAPVANIAVTGAAVDSRLVEPGDIFIALPGASTDGLKFMNHAADRGAVAVLVEASATQPEGLLVTNCPVPVIGVTGLHLRVSDLAGRVYGQPSQTLHVVGVTGTNGKSTTVSLIAQLLEAAGVSAASMGTLGVNAGGKLLNDTGMTTPDAASCHKWLARLRDAGVKAVAMEVSSHGLQQNRVQGIRFETGVFTNLSHDHLDYHGSMEKYAEAKRKLFASNGLHAAVINMDDPLAAQMRQAARNSLQTIGYSLLDSQADVYAESIQYSPLGARFNLTTPWGDAEVESPLLGEFNVYNLLAAIAAVCTKGYGLQQVAAAAAKLKAVDGRMQRVGVAADIGVVVDYAHTPDALAQAIAATRVHTSGRLWVVFGCGGDRDRSKRAAMARIAEQFADQVVVTTDNPRSEAPSAIINDIIAGFSGEQYRVEEDRKRAIVSAIDQAKSGDVIVVAGKGHEKYQLVGAETFFFDDVAVAASALQSRQMSLSQRGH